MSSELTSAPRVARCVQGIQFSVVITEGRPDETGLTMAQALDNMRVPTIAILDCAVAYALEAFRCLARRLPVTLTRALTLILSVPLAWSPWTCHASDCAHIAIADCCGIGFDDALDLAELHA